MFLPQNRTQDAPARRRDARLLRVAAILIGDRSSGIESARAFGCEALLVRTGYGHSAEHALVEDAKTIAFDDLAAAVNAILARS